MCQKEFFLQVYNLKLFINYVEVTEIQKERYKRGIFGFITKIVRYIKMVFDPIL